MTQPNPDDICAKCGADDDDTKLCCGCNRFFCDDCIAWCCDPDDEDCGDYFCVDCMKTE